MTQTYLRTTVTSGCKAMNDCEKKETCLRYKIHQEQNPYRGWSSHQMCKVSEHIVNVYPFYLETLSK